jgi:hypothetical protein
LNFWACLLSDYFIVIRGSKVIKNRFGGPNRLRSGRFVMYNCDGSILSFYVFVIVKLLLICSNGFRYFYGCVHALVSFVLMAEREK